MSVVFLLGGILPLWFGAQLFVGGAASLARRLRVPPIAVGLTVVAFGTSAPELTVNIVSALGGSTEVAMGNVVGSNLANICAILGLSAIVRSLPVNRKTTWVEIPLAVLAAVALLAVSLDPVLDGGAAIIGRSEGLLLLLFFVIFLAYVAGMLKADQAAADGTAPGEAATTEGSRIKSVPLAILATTGGLALLIAGSQLIVEGAVGTARLLGIAERVIASTIVALGTSLPELVTSVVAARKGETDIAVGNIVGSNIFNTFLILGVTATIRPIPVAEAFFLDLLLNLGAALLLFVFVFTGKGRAVTRPEGVMLLAGYAGYAASLILR